MFIMGDPIPVFSQTMYMYFSLGTRYTEYQYTVFTELDKISFCHYLVEHNKIAVKPLVIKESNSKKGQRDSGWSDRFHTSWIKPVPQPVSCYFYVLILFPRQQPSKESMSWVGGISRYTTSLPLQVQQLTSHNLLGSFNNLCQVLLVRNCSATLPRTEAEGFLNLGEVEVLEQLRGESRLFLQLSLSEKTYPLTRSGRSYLDVQQLDVVYTLHHLPLDDESWLLCHLGSYAIHYDFLGLAGVKHQVI